MAVPEIRDAALAIVSGKDTRNVGLEMIEIAQPVRTLLDRDWPFCIGPHSQAGDPEVRGFFLDASGIGDGKATIEDQIHEPNVV